VSCSCRLTVAVRSKRLCPNSSSCAPPSVGAMVCTYETGHAAVDDRPVYLNCSRAAKLLVDNSSGSSGLTCAKVPILCRWAAASPLPSSCSVPASFGGFDIVDSAPSALSASDSAAGSGVRLRKAPTYAWALRQDSNQSTHYCCTNSYCFATQRLATPYPCLHRQHPAPALLQLNELLYKLLVLH
jgi:hypothetical protein